MSAVREEALGLAYLGCAVLPLHGVTGRRCSCGRPDCSSAGKHPRVQHGVREATNDLDVIEGWPWDRANLGIRTGVGLLVLDFDGDPGIQVLEELSSRFPELNLAPRVATGKGHHIYLDVPLSLRHLPRTTVGVRPGMDTRYDRAYVVAPPSTHVSGRLYAWERPLTSLETLTPASADLLFDLFTSPVQAQRRPLARPSEPLLDQALRGYAQDGYRHRGAVWLGVRAASTGVPLASALWMAAQYAERVENPATFSASEATDAVAWAYKTAGGPRLLRTEGRPRLQFTRAPLGRRS